MISRSMKVAATGLLPRVLLFALFFLIALPSPALSQDTLAPTLTIGDARSDRNGDFMPDRLGQTVTVGGRASSNGDVMHTSRLSIFIQDNTGGIEIYNIDPGPPIEEGDSVVVRGTIELYEGITRIVRATYRVIKVHAPMARPADLAIAEAPSEKYEGMLVRINGMVTRSWKDDYGSFLTIREQYGEPDSVVVFLDNRHKPGIDLSKFSERDLVSVTGVLGQYVRGGALNTGYEILPRYPEDVRLRHARTTDYLYALIVSAAFVMLALAWVFSTRKQVANRTRELRESEQRFRNLLENVQLVALTVDHDAHITFANEYMMGLTGWSNEELLAMDLLDVVAPPAGMSRQAYREAVRTGSVPPHFEGELITHTGERRLVAWNTTVVHDPKGAVAGTASLGEDITERKRAEEQLSASLKEKELLVREVYHRVKNNLQTISSLLSLQSESIADPATREMFIENQHRIRSMTMIHERLYRSNSLARIDMREYLQGLANSLFRSYAVNRNISLNVDVRDVVMSADASIVCGLIVNELLSNSLKHAFPEDRTGEITLTMFPGTHGTYELTFADNGVGLPAGFDIHATRTLGMNLITSLSQQLRADIEIATNGGTRYVITIPAT